MRQSCYDAIDVITESFNTQFQQEPISFLSSIEKNLLRSMFESGISENNLTMTNALIDKDKLRLQPDELSTILGFST